MNVTEALQSLAEDISKLPLDRFGVDKLSSNPNLKREVLIKIADSAGPDLGRVTSILDNLLTLGEVGEQSRVFMARFDELKRNLEEKCHTFRSQVHTESNAGTSAIQVSFWSDNRWRDEAALMRKEAENLGEHCRILLVERRFNERDAKLGKEAKIFQDTVDQATNITVHLAEATTHAHELLDKTVASDALIGRSKLVSEAVNKLDGLINFHRLMALVWLGLVIVGVLCSLWLLVWVYGEDQKLFFGCGPTFRPYSGDPNGVGVLAHSISRLVVLSVGISISLLAFRMYGTHMHNVVTNQHRRMSVMMFEYLQDALGPNAEKDSRHNLTVQAVQSILQHGSSGFLGSKSEDILPALHAASEFAKVIKP